MNFSHSRHLYLFAQLVICLLPCAAWAEGISPLSAADTQFAAGKFDDARKSYIGDEKASPDDLAPHLGLIRTLLRLDNWPDALTEAQATAQKFPASADAHGLLSLALIRAGWLEPYGKEAAQSLTLDGKNYWGLVASGRSAIWEGKDAEAKDIFRKATEISPNLPDAWLGLIQSLDDTKDVKEEQKAVNTYLQLAPQGQPHAAQVEEMRDFERNATTYHQSFDSDPPFQQVTITDKNLPAGNSTSVKVEFVGDYAVFPVKINSVPFRLLFDTGAGDLLLTRNAINKLNLPVLAQSTILGISGKEKSDICKADLMSLGDLTYRSILIHTASFSPEGLDGILGGSVLDHSVVTLDYTTATATLSPSTAGAPTPLPGDKVLTLPYHLYQDHLFLPVSVNSVPLWAMLDTGSEVSFLSLRFGKEQVKTLPKSEYRTGTIHEKVGIGETKRQIEFVFSPDQSSITLSQDPPVSVETDTIGQSALDNMVSPNFDFEIGMLFGVSSFAYAQRVTFDYPHHLLIFEYKDPDADTPAKPAPK